MVVKLGSYIIQQMQSARKSDPEGFRRGDVASKTNFFINVLFVMKFGVCMWMIVRIPNMKTVFKYLLYFLSYKHNYTN